MRSWLQICHDYAQRESSVLPWLSVLDAFGQQNLDLGRDTQLQGLSFSDLFRRSVNQVEELSRSIVSAVSVEVDTAQAQMFSRRFLSVVDILQDLSCKNLVAKVLLVGLVHRLQDILLAKRNLALRVRAVVDFYYSQGALLFHRDEEAPIIADLISKIHWSEVETGIFHGRICGSTRHGPVHINLLRIVNRRIFTRDFRDLSGDFASQLKHLGCAFGISGGFFLYSEPDIITPQKRGDPVGLLISNSEIINPPVYRRGSLIQYENGELDIRPVGMDSISVFVPEVGGVSIQRCNQMEGLGQDVLCFNRAFGDLSPSFEGLSISFYGRTVLQKSKESLPIPLAGFVLCIPFGKAEMFAGIKSGSVVEYRFSDMNPIQAGMAGGPILLHSDYPSLNLASEDFANTAPPVTFSKDETFDQNLLPRMGVGLTKNQELVFAAVDGRNFAVAPGVTLKGLGQLLFDLGCVVGLNLDGGSSKRMVVKGDSVDLPSTDIQTGKQTQKRIRPIRSGIAILPNDML